MNQQETDALTERVLKKIKKKAQRKAYREVATRSLAEAVLTMLESVYADEGGAVNLLDPRQREALLESTRNVIQKNWNAHYVDQGRHEERKRELKAVTRHKDFLAAEYTRLTARVIELEDKLDPEGAPRRAVDREILRAAAERADARALFGSGASSSCTGLVG